ncbi:sensor histidine kinase [Sphingomonas sp. SORGH_AS_0879]|uniref:sensor histidine kinase n=1 Tax=Sphingomonas sp. SORGH_AS_0879 TaxID=3041790 RepID=UPI00277DF69F|nr:sensor histidine kinase [Sphingomonas sp. SORGH_AS_0879]MDQ1229184.1 signal transduction histidine kinase [Sphingomonas sp. SORGH_AS_0879]
MLPGPAVSAAAAADRPALTDLRHSRWTLGDGAPGNIRAITQGPDGFLWLGTSTGLYRFDGISFERILPSDERRRRSLQVTALLAARNGDIWVGYDSGGIAVVRHGVLRDANPWTPDGGVDSIVQARDGSIWVTGDSRGVLLVSRLKDGRWMRIGPRQGYTPGEMGPILAAADGSVYLSSPPAVLRLRPGMDHFETLPFQAAPYATLAEQPVGTIWLADDKGLRRLGGTGGPVSLAGANTPFARRTMRADRDGHLWILAQDDGLTRFTPTRDGPGTAERMTVEQGLTSTLSLSTFEDREGNIWVGTASGLDRFSPANVAQSPVREGIVTGFVRSRTGSRLFVAGLSGIYRIDAGQPTPRLIFRKPSIGVLCGDDRHLLTFSLEGHYRLDLTPSGSVAHVRKVGDPLSISCVLDQQGRFWTGRDRLYQLIGSQLVPAAGASGEKKGTLGKLRVDPQGGLIFSRPSTGFRRRIGTTESALWPRKAPTIGAISTMAFDGRAILAGAEAGVGRWDGRAFANLRQRDYPFLADITGILPTPDGSTWLIGVDGIVRTSTKALNAAFDRPGRPLPIERFGYYEDFAARTYMNQANDAAQDASGRIWFATNKGLAYVDPAGIVKNTLPPPVTIRSLTAAGRVWTPSDTRIALPAGTDRVQIDYTGLSLTDAKANRFRYRLEGADTVWTDAQGRRQALYTNLGPGVYSFHVLAANNDGVWNREGAVLRFEIAPRFYQTMWFALLCALGVGGLLWLLYRQRLRIIADRTRAGFEAQLSERERIARELHDTLLQGFQGLMLRFQAAAEKLPPGGEARMALEGALDRADDVLLEGRDRVRALREDMEPVHLRPRLSALAGAILPAGMDFAIDEKGRARPVCAPVADEIASIVAEALANTARHAHASNVHVGIVHGLDKLTVTVRDDGRGLPADVLAAGHREGHFGLVGMRERAMRLGGTLSITSPPQDGTHIAIVMPARIAYR